MSRLFLGTFYPENAAPPIPGKLQSNMTFVANNELSITYSSTTTIIIKGTLQLLSSGTAGTPGTLTPTAPGQATFTEAQVPNGN